MSVGDKGDMAQFSPQQSSTAQHPPPSRDLMDILKPAEPLASAPAAPNPDIFTDFSESSSEAFNPPGTKPSHPPFDNEPKATNPPTRQPDLPGNYVSSPFYDSQPPPLEQEEPKSGDMYDDLFDTKSYEDDEDSLFGGISSSVRDEPPPLRLFSAATEVLPIATGADPPTTVRAVETEKKHDLDKKTPASSLFGEDEEDSSELFGEKKIIKKKDKTATSSVKSKSSLFGEDDDDDDLFLSATSLRATSSSSGNFNN